MVKNPLGSRNLFFSPRILLSLLVRLTQPPFLSLQPAVSRGSYLSGQRCKGQPVCRPVGPPEAFVWAYGRQRHWGGRGWVWACGLEHWGLLIYFWIWRRFKGVTMVCCLVSVISLYLFFLNTILFSFPTHHFVGSLKSMTGMLTS